MAEARDETPLEGQEEQQDRRDHHDRGRAGQRPVAPEARQKFVVAERDGKQVGIAGEDEGGLELVPDAEAHCQPHGEEAGPGERQHDAREHADLVGPVPYTFM